MHMRTHMHLHTSLLEKENKQTSKITRGNVGGKKADEALTMALEGGQPSAGAEGQAGTNQCPENGVHCLLLLYFHMLQPCDLHMCQAESQN